MPARLEIAKEAKPPTPHQGLPRLNEPLKDQGRLDAVSAPKALASAVGGRARVQAVSLGGLVVNHALQLGKVVSAKGSASTTPDP